MHVTYCRILEASRHIHYNSMCLPSYRISLCQPILFTLLSYFIYFAWNLTYKISASGMWFWSFPFQSKHISFFQVSWWNCKFPAILQWSDAMSFFLFGEFSSINKKLILFIDSLSGWHLKSSAMNHQMKNQIYTVLVWFCGSWQPCSNHGATWILHRLVNLLWKA